MKDFDDSTLWPVSHFERVRRDTGTSGYARLQGVSVLPSSLMGDLRRLDSDPASSDVLEVAAACMRHREPALLYLQLNGFVWPVTLFPNELFYHSPRDMLESPGASLTGLAMLMVEPPGVRPPGHGMHERIGRAEHYRPLLPLLWALALNGPRTAPLAEIAGTVAYRATRSPEDDQLPVTGAMRSAAERLRRETVSLRAMAGWPGMSVERASRLVNGLYLVSALMATRGHPAARSEPKSLRDRLFGPRARH